MLSYFWIFQEVVTVSYNKSCAFQDSQIKQRLIFKGILTSWNKFISDHSLSVYNLPEKKIQSDVFIRKYKCS